MSTNLSSSSAGWARLAAREGAREGKPPAQHGQHTGGPGRWLGGSACRTGEPVPLGLGTKLGEVGLGDRQRRRKDDRRS